MRTRILVAICAMALMAVGTGGVIAAGGGSSSGDSAAKSEYKPGVGPCKDGGTTPSGTHTGAPGNGQNCETKPGNSARSTNAIPAKCAARKSFTVVVKGMKKGHVKVGGKKVRVRNGKAKVKLTNKLRRSLKVTAKGRSKSGKRVRASRQLNLCAAKPKGKLKAR